MNRRANAYLNVISFTTFILTFLLFIITIRIESMDNTIYFPINKRPDIEKITKFSDEYFPNNITSLFNEDNPLR